MSGTSSQHWFKLWIGVIGQQAINWTNVDLYLHVCRHMGSVEGDMSNYSYFNRSLGNIPGWVSEEVSQKVRKQLRQFEPTAFSETGFRHPTKKAQI